MEQLEKILGSRLLQGSGNLRSLLRYVTLKVIEDQDIQLKEYIIATDVFGRGSDFDARTDSVVRVQAKRLREKLKEYYETEGKEDRVLIELPKGQYNVAFSFIEREGEERVAAEPEPPVAPLGAQTPQEQEGAAQTPPAPSPSLLDGEKLWKMASGAALLVLLGSIIVLSLSYNNFRTQSSETGPTDLNVSPGAVWDPFMRSGLPTLLVLSNPPVYRFSNGSDPEVLLKKSMEMTSEQTELMAQSLKDKFVMRQSHAPRLILSSGDYTGMGEAIGVYCVTDLFRSSGKKIALKQSRTVSAEDLKSNNMILLGSVWANEWSGKLPIKEDFTYSLNATIDNNNPLPGEEREYRPKFNEQTGELVEDYALITVKPSVSVRNILMVLSGIHSEGTQAAAEYVTRRDYLNNLNQRLEQMAVRGTPPKYYQVLLKVQVVNGISMTVSIVSIHQLVAAGE
ncbi:MAG TPA: hypothetical protein VE262_11430 [Blastocatellia bacterium]|nr:hypothetical protein [Blastocatellia bacterium]